MFFRFVTKHACDGQTVRQTAEGGGSDLGWFCPGSFNLAFYDFFIRHFKKRKKVIFINLKIM